MYNLQEDDDRTELVQILIQAEADPTALYNDRWSSKTLLAWALEEGGANVIGSPEQVIPSISKYLSLYRDSHTIQERFHLMLGGVYAGLEVAGEVWGLSIWLYACTVASPDTLRKLLATGCSVAETCISGWNCLFFLVLRASRPEHSIESESLRMLLSAGADPFLRDVSGHTIFDYLDDDDNVFNPKFAHYIGYHRELWYNALTQAHIAFKHLVRPGQEKPISPVYSPRFTPVHHRALRHLESWEMNDIQSQVDKLLVDIPWSEEEAEALAYVNDLREAADRKEQERVLAYRRLSYGT
jgi:hypothetical protein